MKHQFKTNIMCGGCIAKITPHLSSNEAIQHWEVDTQVPDKILTVETDTLTASSVREIVQQAGYKAEPVHQ